MGEDGCIILKLCRNCVYCAEKGIEKITEDVVNKRRRKVSLAVFEFYVASPRCRRNLCSTA